MVTVGRVGLALDRGRGCHGRGRVHGPARGRPFDRCPVATGAPSAPRTTAINRTVSVPLAATQASSSARGVTVTEDPGNGTVSADQNAVAKIRRGPGHGLDHDLGRDPAPHPGCRRCRRGVR